MRAVSGDYPVSVEGFLSFAADAAVSLPQRDSSWNFCPKLTGTCAVSCWSFVQIFAAVCFRGSVFSGAGAVVFHDAPVRCTRQKEKQAALCGLAGAIGRPGFAGGLSGNSEYALGCVWAAWRCLV